MNAPVYDRHGVQVHHGDCLDVMRGMPDASVHAIVTDPPAGIRFMGRAWDTDMGGRHTWVAWLSERMTEAHRVLKPGGYGLVWALPRTSHWTAWALEDAGFEVRDCIVHLFGSGFPKSLDVGKAIDKQANAAPLWDAIRGHIREWRDRAGMTNTQLNDALGLRTTGSGMAAHWTRTGPNQQAIPSKEMWVRLKAILGWPDCELDAAYAAAKGGAERPVIGERTTGLGTGGGSIAYIADGDNRDITAPATDAARQWHGWGTALKPAAEHWWLIRKPMSGTVAATVLEHGTGALNVGAARVTAGQDYRDKCASVVGLDSNRNAAGRWPANMVLTHAARCEGDGCQPDWCPVAELDGQSGVLTSGDVAGSKRNSAGATQGVIGAWYADSGGASRFFPQFRWEAKAPASERPMVDGKAHETVKPLGLMRWMVRLVCAPGGTILDCFAGSGTTGQAARAEGMRAVLIEQDADHMEKIRARLDARPKTTEATAQPADDEPVDLLDLLDGTAS